MNYFPESGLKRLLNQALGRIPNDEQPLLILFTNNVTESAGLVPADLTEATFTGYAPVSLDPANWTSPVIDGVRAVSTYTALPQVWTNGGSSQTLYGAAILSEDETEIIWLEKFAAALVLSGGLTVGYLPRLTSKGEV